MNIELNYDDSNRYKYLSFSEASISSKSFSEIISIDMLCRSILLVGEWMSRDVMSISMIIGGGSS